LKILIKGVKKTVTELKLLYITSFIVSLLVIIPISNFLLEGIDFIISGNISLGIAGGEEVLGTLKVLILTSFFGGGLGTLNGWLLSNCDFKFRKVLRICQLVPLAAPAYLITAILLDLGSILGYQVTGLWWGVLILSISTYPYVFILANESFNKFGVNQINASRGLGVGPWRSFFKIAFPMALPALITGISLMCMEVMNEFGTFALLNNPSISIATESPVDVQEVFVGSETMDGDALKYPKGKAEIRLQRVELAEGGIVPLHSHPIPLLGNVEKGTIVVKRQGMEDLTYTSGDTFIVGPKTPKHTMGNAKTDNAIVWFAAIGAKDVPILIPAEG